MLTGLPPLPLHPQLPQTLFQHPDPLLELSAHGVFPLAVVAQAPEHSACPRARGVPVSPQCKKSRDARGLAAALEEAHAAAQSAGGSNSAAYERAQHIDASPTRDAAREAMLLAWRRAGLEHPGESRLMLAYTRDDVQALNTGARALKEAAGDLKRGEIIETERGPREFAAGDRLYFLRNERSLGVKNGTLGTIEKLRAGILQVRLDGEGERRVAVDTRFYAHLDHGYAATVYKAQGATVDRTFVLASPHFDRHSTYVALSRHRESAAMFYGREDFRGDFKAVLARARPKALAHDYLERPVLGAERTQETPAPTSSPSMTPAERFRQQVDAAAQRFALEREAERPAREALQRRRALEQYRALERQRELVRQRQLEQHRGLSLG